MNEAYPQTSTATLQTPYTQRGLVFSRRFSTEGVSPYEEMQWERRTASITDTKGNTIFEQKDVDVPVDWSMTATNIVASKYLHGHLGTPERETGVRQLLHDREIAAMHLHQRGSGLILQVIHVLVGGVAGNLKEQLARQGVAVGMKAG